MCLDRASEPLLSRVGEIVRSEAPPEQILRDLVDNLIDVIVSQPAMAAVVMRERHNLAPESRAWFARSQRMHVEEWVHVLVRIRPELRDNEARLLVRAVLALLDGSADFVHDVPPDQARTMLRELSISGLLNTSTGR